MRNIRFSILIVTLNAEKEIQITIESICKQIYKNYEVIVKDGNSEDKTLYYVPNDVRFRIVKEKDNSVYDGMNQAIQLARGEFLLFLNAGDYLYNQNVLQQINEYINNREIDIPCVLYGNYSRGGEYIQNQKRILTNFLLYRRPLCHQSMFYHRDIFKQGEQYNIDYKISADHDLTLRLWKQKIPFYHTGLVVCQYRGGGLSETVLGLALAKKEKKQIQRNYYSRIERLKYDAIILFSFACFRSWIDSQKSPAFLRDMYRAIRNCLFK